MFRLTVEDTFTITGRGLVATGRIEEGSLSVGDTVSIDGREATVDGIEKFREILDHATTGDNVGLLFSKLTNDDVKRGSVITGAGSPRSTIAPDQLEAMQDAGLVEEPKSFLKKLLGR
jgi:elongation factor Tu